MPLPPNATPHPLPQVTDEIMEIIVRGTADTGGAGASKSYNVFHYRKTTNAALTNKTNVRLIFRTSVIVPLLAAANARYRPNFTWLRNVQNAADAFTQFTETGAGAIGTDSLPSDDAIVVKLTSAVRGKKCKGFKHFGMGNEEDTTNDILTAAAGGLARWQAVRAAVALVLTDADGNVWTPFILSRNSKFTSFTVPVVLFGANVNDAKLILQIGTMRKRRTPTVYA